MSISKLRAVASTIVSTALVLSVWGCSSASQSSSSGGGQGWEPTRDVTLTVPTPAGGGTDTMARAIAQGLEKVRPDINIVVENRPGGDTATGYTYVLQQKGEPHQLVAIEGNLGVLPLATNTPYTWKDFTPIGQVSYQVGLLAVPGGKYSSLSEFLHAARGQPPLLGTAGRRSVFSLVAKALAAETGTQFQQVPFATGSKTLNALVAGDVQAAIISPEHAVEHIESGKLDGLAVFTKKRIPFGVLKDVPTAQQKGLDVVFSGVRGLMAPGDLTAAQQRYWEEAFRDWTKTPSYEKYIKKTQSLAHPTGAKGLRSELAEFHRKSQELMKQEEK